ncbi:MAG TPA: hemolysin family protein [Vicinamibacterales bacterium]|nr:hemolysin family protein [Vicinamibacterales bacterium]
MLTDIVLVFVLILLNGAFALSEIAIVSSRRTRLAQLTDAGHPGARHALALASEPTRFLSSVQVGITSIGILNGAIGEASIASRLRVGLEQIPVLMPYAQTLSLTVMVVGLTYVSLIFGELVPKRLALTNPERIAAIIAKPMAMLARAGRPIVFLLSLSTDTILRLLGVRTVKQPAVTMEEIRVLLEQGTEEGIVERTEQEMVTNVLNLDDRLVGAVLTPRSEVMYLDVHEPIERTRDKLGEGFHTVLPLCDGGFEHVLGFVRVTRILEQLLASSRLELVALAEEPLFVPETMTLMKLLEQFKRTHLPVALVVDEFGDIEGLVSMTDVISSIVGDLPADPTDEPMIVRRDDGSWLLDGALDLDVVMRTLETDSLGEDDDRRHFHTLGGLAMAAIGRVPRTGDVFSRGVYRFEVVDMDGNRVDRVLVSRTDSRPSPNPTAPHPAD